jgi:hypothetical protein
MTEDGKTATQAKTAKTARQSVGSDMQGDGIADALAQAGQNYFEAMAAMHETFMQIADDHRNVNAEAAEAIARCHSFNEAMQIQSDLLRSSGAAYMRGWQRWLDTSSRFAADHLVQPRQAH